MTKKRLSKALAAAGVASRRACEEIIFEGRVKVNGIAVFEPQHHVCWDTDKITLDGSPVAKEQQKVYYILNKPKGYLCTNAALEGKKKLVIDLFPAELRLFTIGRLDRDTTGLLLVTNDGIFAQKVIHPSSNIEKEYIGKSAEEISLEQLKDLSRGAPIDEKWIRPVRVSKVRRGTFKIVVKEGKKHEIRILAEKAGIKLLELKRVRIGGLHLGTIPEGHYRALSDRDKKALFSSKTPE
jgi:23S rRNA pseudouridine2605 synthase